MKKIVLLLLIGIIAPFVVSAQEYNVNTLIPVDQVGTVNTEKFTYNGFIYNSQVDGKGNCLFSFNSIQNNTLSKTAVSINVLLFDEQQKNIGFLTYCSDKDVSSEYSGFKLAGNQASAFSINVTSRYFIDGKGPGNVRFIAVKDENKYCQIGGYTKYQGLTIEEITNGGSSNSGNEKMREIFILFRDKGLQMLVIMILSAVGFFVVYGMFLNALYRRMYAKTTFLAYLPIANTYISVKMAFGKIVAIVVLVANLLGGLLAVFKISFVSYLIVFVQIIAFIVDVIKFITKKYDLLYFEPSINNIGYDNDNNFSSMNNSFLSGNSTDSNQQMVDLSYDDVSNNDSLSNMDFSSNNISSGEVKSSNNKESTLDGEINDDVSNNDSLSSMDFSSNNISSGEIKLNDNKESTLDGEIDDDDSSDELSYDDELDRILGVSSNNESSKNSDSDSNGESDLSKFFN